LVPRLCQKRFPKRGLLKFHTGPAIGQGSGHWVLSVSRGEEAAGAFVA
jgi:hypothetical protein